MYSTPPAGGAVWGENDRNGIAAIARAHRVRQGAVNASLARVYILKNDR